MAYNDLPALGQANMAGSLPVVLASDQASIPVTLASTTVTGSVAVTNAGLTALNGAISGTEVQVDVLTLPAIPAGTNNIGDVDVLTINGVAPAFGTGLRGATVQRVTIATDDSVPVTNAGITTIAGAVSGTEMQVDVLTMPTTTVTATNLDIRDLTQASDSILIYGSDDGGTTKRVIKTDAGGAIQVDLEVASVAVTSIAAGDNNIGNVDIVSSALPTGASTLAEQQSQTTHLATIAGDTTSIQAAVELIDDTVYTDGAGTVTKGIAILGQDGTNPQAIKTDANGELQVDVLTMPIVAVTQSGTWDEVGINDSGNSITIDNSTLAVVGGGTEAAAMRVTIASDSTGVLSVDDNGSTLSVDDGGGSLTVDGTVTANLSATDNAVLDNIDLATTSKYITGIGHGVATVTTAGTDVAIAGSTACKKVVIQAQTDNTNIIAVGGSGVDATIATGTGVVLYPGDVFEFDIDNLADVFIDSLVNGEGVRYTYFT